MLIYFVHFNLGLEVLPKANENGISNPSSNCHSHSRKNETGASKLPPNSTSTSRKDNNLGGTQNTTDKTKSYPPETLLSLAVEAAIIGLGQQRIMPPGNISHI